jgi:RNA polymerase sigma-70 factor (sigma-E family)
VGGRADYQEFVTARGGQLFKVAYFICGDWHDAQDLLQTSLAKLYVAWNRIERGEGADAYARKILLRTYLSQRRLKRSGETSAEQCDLGTQLPAKTADHDLHLTLTVALRLLPPRNRAAVVLRYLEGHPIETVAEYMGASPAAVKSLNTRSLARLRELLGDDREALFQ